MPKLMLKFKNTVIADFQLRKGLSLTIGRRKNNDVVIENLAVSGHHARIDSVGDGFVLIDLKSKNGSFVNEKIINTHWLKNGDVINIGKHSLAFNYIKGEKIPDSGYAKIERTMVMDTSQYRSMMKKSEPHAPNTLIKSDDRKSAGGLAFLAGGSGKIRLSGKITKIGKHPKSDIVLSGLWIGQTAVSISKRPDGFYLSYVGGFSKPKVNDKRVKNSIMLNDLDIIDIGSAKLQFHKLTHYSKSKLSPKKKAVVPPSDAG